MGCLGICVKKDVGAYGELLPRGRRIAYERRVGSSSPDESARKNLQQADLFLA